MHWIPPRGALADVQPRRGQLKPDWSGVFPAVTTQFREDLSLDIDATARVMQGLIRDGVSGLIVCGTVGENCSLTRDEKIAVMEAGKTVARGRVPVLSGIAEFTSAFAIDMAKEAARIGLDGVMVQPICR
jgi:dihydrodipicolinate synthase/N-acetylneuraminate lyase